MVGSGEACSLLPKALLLVAVSAALTLPRVWISVTAIAVSVDPRAHSLSVYFVDCSVFCGPTLTVILFVFNSVSLPNVASTKTQR